MKKYLQSCKTEFWQKVFEAESNYLLHELQGARDVLSVGCGPSIIEGTLSGRGFRVTGLDVSREALGCAPDRVRTVAAHAEDMPFAESSFDAAIFVVSLQFIEDYGKALKKTAFVLRPNGRVILMLLKPESDFFKEKLRNPDSYVRKMRHPRIDAIENAADQLFDIVTEHFLGVKDGNPFESRDVADTVLYIIKGIKKPLEDDKKS